jgi:hypothetical protein
MVFKRQVWHGTNVLDRKGAIKDKIVLLTHAYGLSIILGLLSLFTLNNYLFVMSISGLLIIPIFASIYRCFMLRKDNSKISVTKRFFFLVPLFNAFLWGRFIGLLNNYLKKAVKPFNG